VAGTVTSIRLDTPLADEAAKVLGMKTRTEAVLHAWEKNHPILTPTEGNRLASGKLLSKPHPGTGFTPGRLRITKLHGQTLLKKLATKTRAHEPLRSHALLWFSFFFSIF